MPAQSRPHRPRWPGSFLLRGACLRVHPSQQKQPNNSPRGRASLAAGLRGCAARNSGPFLPPGRCWPTSHTPHSEKSCSRWAPSPQPRPGVTGGPTSLHRHRRGAANPTHPLRRGDVHGGCAFSEEGKEAARRFGWGRSSENPVLVYIQAEDSEADDALGFYARSPRGPLDTARV